MASPFGHAGFVILNLFLWFCSHKPHYLVSFTEDVENFEYKNAPV